MYMNDPNAAPVEPVNHQAVNTWVQPDFRGPAPSKDQPRNLVGKVRDFGI